MKKLQSPSCCSPWSVGLHVSPDPKFIVKLWKPILGIQQESILGISTLYFLMPSCWTERMFQIGGALRTGANSGIGKEIAQFLATKGALFCMEWGLWRVQILRLVAGFGWEHPPLFFLGDVMWIIQNDWCFDVFWKCERLQISIFSSFGSPDHPRCHALHGVSVARSAQRQLEMKL